MDTLSDIPDTSYELPLSEADQAALRPALLRDLGAMPFTPGAPISRSLWVIFIGEWGAWTHAVPPVDDSLGMADDENLIGLCDLIGSLLRPPRCHNDEKAMIVLRRPGSPEISEADAHIFRQVRQAATRRETAPWAFHVTGPAGTREVTEHEAPQDPARTPAGITGSAEEFLEDGGSPGRDLFAGEELRAYPEGRLGGIHLGARPLAEQLHVGPGFIQAGFHAAGQRLGEHERCGGLQCAVEHVGGAGRLESQGPPVLAAGADLGEFHLAPRLRAQSRDAAGDRAAGR